MDEQTLSNARAGASSWLHPHMGTTTGDSPAPQDYMIALQHVALTLDADPAWRSWWRRSGMTACELGIVAEGRLDHLRPSADIRRLDDRLQANFTCALPAGTPPENTAPTPDGRELATRTATEEVRAMFEVIRQALTLPALPPTPPPRGGAGGCRGRPPRPPPRRPSPPPRRCRACPPTCRICR